MTQVFDLNGQERDMEWLAANYDGAVVLPARLAPTDTKVWRLAAIYLTTGTIVAKGETRNNGLPVSNQPIAFSYPTLAQANPDLGLLPAGVNNWTSRAVVQRTDGGGITGFGLGRTFGPFYHMWVMSNAPSDCLSRIGMKGGTNHTGPLHGVWVLEDAEPAFATLRAALLWKAEAKQVIQFNPDAALQKQILANGFVPNSPEFDLAFGGQEYVAQRAEQLTTGEVRVYYAPKNNYGSVQFQTR